MNLLIVGTMIIIDFVGKFDLHNWLSKPKIKAGENMANVNDFKILNYKCRTYFKMLETELGRTIHVPTDKHIERFGFYIFILESICNVKDILDVVDLICDEEFNSIIYGAKHPDFGVDAVFIDEEANQINLFNFKFREAFNPDKQQNLNETFLTSKFTNAIDAEDLSGFSGKLEGYLKKIIELLKGNGIWKLRLYVVSNESKEIDVNSAEIRLLKKNYDLETIPMGLDTIANLMSLRPAPINAIIHVDKESILPFTESSLSSSKSYVIKISANDLIRITCDNDRYRDEYTMEDYSLLFDSAMEYNLLFDNVRGLVTKSKFNDNLYKTLKDEPSKFFMYNNGLTLTATDIDAEETNAQKRIKIAIKDFQVVNGGQTLRTLHRFKKQDKDHINNYLANCELLLRVFKTSTAGAVRNKIAEYTNSQNAISSIDLKSLSAEQIQIELFLDDHNIIYARKIGDTGLSLAKQYDHKISMEKFGQILFALKGYPEKASNQKKHIFEKYYDMVFREPNFELTKSVEYVTRYFEIKKVYETLGITDTSDQKLFYILYLDTFLDASIQDKISLLETSITKFKPKDKDLPDVRKVLYVTFREFLDEEVKEYKRTKT